MTVCSMTQVKVNSRKFGHCQRLSPPPFIMGAGKWPQILKLRHNMYCMWNQQNVHDVTITLSHNYYTVKVFWSDKGIVIWEDSVRLLITLRSPEVLWCSSGCHQHQIPTTSVPIGTVDVLPVSSVRDLGVHIDSDVTMRSHVTACQDRPCDGRRHCVYVALFWTRLQSAVNHVVWSRTCYYI